MIAVTARRAKSRLRATIAALICLAMAGCVGPPSVPNQQARASAFHNPAISLESASAMIAIGTSTHADVLAALGPGTVISFNSGFEIWVYRDTPSRTATRPAELVILFAPSGIVTKTRIKPPY